MNLYSISRLPDDLPKHPLGEPKRAKPQEQKPVEQWKPTETKGYEKNSVTGAVRKAGLEERQQAPKKPTSIDGLADGWWDEGDSYQRLVSLRGGCRCHLSAPCGACSNPITEEEAQEIGLIERQPQPKSGRIEWAGGECPCDPSSRVHVYFRGGSSVGHRMAMVWNWQLIPSFPDAEIIAYEVLEA